MVLSSADNVGTSPISVGSELLKELSRPWLETEWLKRRIERAARSAGMTYWRAFDVWYCKARRIEQFELDQIREAVKAKREREAKNELHDLKLRLARLEASLAAGDADFHRPSIDYAGELVRQIGGMDRAMARKR